jgi:Ligated ion channel L-glutamate- and glycine-binding site
MHFRFLNKTWNNELNKELNIFVALSPCKELTFKHWTFWRNNSLFLLPETKYIATNLKLNLNSRIYYLDSSLSVFEIFKYQQEDISNVEQKIGNANSTELLSKTSFIWERRSNLTKVCLHVIYIEKSPFIIAGNESQKLKGFFGEIFHTLQENLGFKYVLHHRKDNIYGPLQTNGHYSGLLGDIQLGKSNWSVSDVTPTSSRSETFDFSIPLMNPVRKIVTRRPSENFDTSSYFIVFSNNFWIVLIFSAIMLVFFMYWILRLDSVDDKYQSNWLAAAFSFTMLSLVCRESYVLDASWSGKILFLSVIFWGFLISVSYNAILTSVLASSKTSPINSLEEMLESKYTLIFRSSGVIRDFFEKGTENSVGKLGFLHF